jgi:hypothetical protein
MLALLRAGDYDGVHAAVGRLQEIHRPHPTLPPDSDSTLRFERLMAFEREIAQVSVAEESAHGAAAMLTRGHGLVRSRRGCRLTRIAYVFHPQNVLHKLPCVMCFCTIFIGHPLALHNHFLQDCHRAVHYACIEDVVSHLHVAFSVFFPDGQFRNHC